MTYLQARYRLQLLAELGVGRTVRNEASEEDAAMQRLAEATIGHR